MQPIQGVLRKIYLKKYSEKKNNEMFTAKCNFNKVLKRFFLESLFTVNNYESFYKTCKNLVETKGFS